MCYELCLPTSSTTLQPSLIITTPITYGVPAVAEALHVPLHIISAVPWVPSKVGWVSVIT